MEQAAAPLIIGIDGGGTGCRVALCSLDGKRLATASGGAANVTSDAAGALRNLRQAIATLGLSPDQLRACVAHAGLAGVLTEAEAKAVAQALPFGQCVVSDDRQTTVEGALAGGLGLVASVGTGSFVAVKSSHSIRYLGGWGLHLGDQASGAWLGREALRQTVLALDGLAPPSPLTETLHRQIGGSPAHLIAFAQTAKPADFARLAPLVIKAARAEDPYGRDLMQRGAAYLEKCFESADLGAETPLQIVLTGSLGPHYAPYLPRYSARLTPPQGTALDGALRLARLAYDAGQNDPSGSPSDRQNGPPVP